MLVHLDAVDVRRVKRENTLYTDSIGNFADGKHFGHPTALNLNHGTAETLETLFVTLDNLVGYRDGIPALERRNLLLGSHRGLGDFD